MNRFVFWKNIKNRNLRKNGPMNWQFYIIKPGIKKNVWIYVMRSFYGLMKENMS